MRRAPRTAGKAAFVLLAVVLILFSFYTSANAYELPSAADILPDEVSDALPDKAYEEIVGESSGSGITEILDYICRAAGDALAPVLKSLAGILGAVMLSSVLNNVSGLTVGDSLRRVFGYIASLCLALMLYSLLQSLWESALAALSRLNVLMNAMTAVTTAVYAMSGNVTTSAVSGSQVMIAMTVIEDVCFYGLRPVLRVCFGLSFVSSVSGSLDLSGLASFVRKTFTTLLVTLMTIMTAIMGFGSKLTQANDTMAIRTIKLVSGSFVPVVGNFVSEATRTVAGGMSALKSTVGVAGIAALAATVLPCVCSVWLNRMMITLCSVISDILGLPQQSRLLRGCAELLNFVIAILCSVGLLFTINLIFFANSAVAVSG